uniref:Uncharacterized protein n=1 Tax=Brassica oleracea TaxID=3712 RepID=A0A3P6CC83_BRAOL|nr:unnamed protein product [Brassica oleracea]
MRSFRCAITIKWFLKVLLFLNVYHLIFANGRRSHYTRERVFPRILVGRFGKLEKPCSLKRCKASSCTAATKALEEADVSGLASTSRFLKLSQIQVETINSFVSWSPPPQAC